VNTTATDDADLLLAEQDDLRQELQLISPSLLMADPTSDTALVEHSQTLVADILAIGDNQEARDAAKAGVETMALNLQQEAARRSGMLKEPLGQLAGHSEDGGDVAKALVDLRSHVEDLDPSDVNLKQEGFGRLLSKIPGIGTPLRRYFSRYESASSVIDSIIRSLKNGKEQLKRDNITLADDQKAMRALSFKLEQAVKVGRLVDEGLEKKLSEEIPSDDPRTKFIQEELLFPLRQRIQDLQQQLLVNQQGFLTIEMIARNNKELIRGVDRAVNVTVSALQVAVTLAMALANQRIVLEQVQAVTETTNKLLAGTAERLKTQGAEIQRQASSTQLDMDVLKQAFADVRTALEDVSTYRQEALPKMAQSILDMDRMAAEAEEVVRDVEESKRVAARMQFDMEDVAPDEEGKAD